MKPYSYIEWDEPFDKYTKQLRRFVESTGLIENGTFFNPISAARVYHVIPDLQELFNKYGINDMVSMAVIRVLPASLAPNFPHVDVMPSAEQKVAINWPVLNCDDTFTTFYEKKPDANPEVVKLPNGLPYERYSYDDVIETHRIKIDKPVALRYDVLHAVVNETKNTRITVSFRFKTNHWELFNG